MLYCYIHIDESDVCFFFSCRTCHLKMITSGSLHLGRWVIYIQWSSIWCFHYSLNWFRSTVCVMFLELVGKLKSLQSCPPCSSLANSVCPCWLQPKMNSDSFTFEQLSVDNSCVCSLACSLNLSLSLSLFFFHTHTHTHTYTHTHTHTHTHCNSHTHRIDRMEVEANLPLPNLSETSDLLLDDHIRKVNFMNNAYL